MTLYEDKCCWEQDNKCDSDLFTALDLFSALHGHQPQNVRFSSIGMHPYWPSYCILLQGLGMLIAEPRPCAKPRGALK